MQVILKKLYDFLIVFANNYLKRIFHMAIMLTIKVKTRSGKQSHHINKNGVLHILLKNAPEHNKANSELILYLAKLLHIDASHISIHHGKKDSKKTLLLQTSLTLEDVYKKLGVETQHAIF